MPRVKKYPGRPEKPFKKDSFRWSPTGPEDHLFCVRPPLLNGDTASGQIGRLVADLFLRTRPVPILRRYLDVKAIHQWGFPPAFVRATLDSITRRPGVFGGDIIRNRKNRDRDSIAYGIDPLKPEDLLELEEMVNERESILTASVLGAAGERYVRYHLKHSEHFHSITRASDLGYESDDTGKNRLDLTATDSKGRRYAISVKNSRDFLDARTMRWIYDVVRMAQDRKRCEIPWIIPAFATAGAIKECKALGVRCTPVGARIAPEKYGTKFTRKAIERLHATLGPEPFRYVGAQRVHKHDEDFLRDLALVADHGMEPTL